jgi:peptidyl-prolyl cis-trans isomerase A (cyclophilin A)
MRLVQLLVFALPLPAVLLASCGPGPITMPATPTVNVPNATSSPGAIPAETPAPMASPAGSAPQGEAVTHDPSQLDPALATAHAPDVFHARFMTTRGAFVVEVHRAWAPNGADRFYNLVKMGVYDDTRFFRVVDGFMVQFGLPADPRVSAKWRNANIQDDPVTQSNTRGFMTFAQTGAPNSRTTQVFINYVDNSRLDATRFAPFGQVVQGMNVVDSLYKGYGEGRPGGQGPDQTRIQEAGNRYLDEEFPQLDRILSAQVQ